MVDLKPQFPCINPCTAELIICTHSLITRKQPAQRISSIGLKCLFARHVAKKSRIQIRGSQSTFHLELFPQTKIYIYNNHTVKVSGYVIFTWQ